MFPSSPYLNWNLDFSPSVSSSKIFFNSTIPISFQSSFSSFLLLSFLFMYSPVSFIFICLWSCYLIFFSSFLETTFSFFNLKNNADVIWNLLFFAINFFQRYFFLHLFYVLVSFLRSTKFFIDLLGYFFLPSVYSFLNVRVLFEPGISSRNWVGSF